ncbi:phosphonopyruvate decarboxylase [Vibrio fluminensis]|uniref:phosphonopyruvate decarboxylase n=1 Tax=Vibrio fluminensis TaxID=2783614 RepID=UPI001888D1E8|nr:phosphonopyruvate decarboxylase [Vibrio fluminensis]
MIDLAKVYRIIKRAGVEFISGVPDTLLNDFCLGLETYWNPTRHVLAANEGNSIALAAGYHLATNTVPLVYMQNSGMGNALNPLISLTDESVYSIPMVMIIGWRGEPNSGDWPQHQRQGELSPVILDALNIPYRVLDEDEDASLDAIEWAISEARKLSQPVALLVRKNVLSKKEKSGFEHVHQVYSLSREDAIKEIINQIPRDSLIVASTGRITRELHAIREYLNQSHEFDFLNVGAMGHAISIAAGIATARPDRQVVCLDGDAASLMHMGSLPITANLKLSNLIHIVLNNGVHESVGGQESVGYMASLTGIASSSGYETLGKFVSTTSELQQGVAILRASAKPAFLEVRIKKGMRSDMPVLKADTKALKHQFICSAVK